MLRAVRSSLDDPLRHSPIRRAIAKDLFYNAESATEKAVTWLTDKLTPAMLPTVSASQAVT